MCSPLEQIEELHERLGGLKTLSDYARVSHRRDRGLLCAPVGSIKVTGRPRAVEAPFRPLMRQRFHGPARNNLA